MGRVWPGIDPMARAAASRVDPGRYFITLRCFYVSTSTPRPRLRQNKSHTWCHVLSHRDRWAFLRGLLLFNTVSAISNSIRKASIWFVLVHSSTSPPPTQHVLHVLPIPGSSIQIGLSEYEREKLKSPPSDNSSWRFVFPLGWGCSITMVKGPRMLRRHPRLTSNHHHNLRYPYCCCRVHRKYQQLVLAAR